MQPEKLIELDFITLEFYPNYLISTIKEGVFFDFEHLEQISALCDKYYNNSSFVSIANRKYDYSLNPFCLMETHYIPNIIGIAVVCHSKRTFNAATFEKKFYKNKFKVFKEMKSCFKWTQQLIEKHQETKSIVDN